MAKNPYDATPKAGSKRTLQSVTFNGNNYDPRNAPCGTNTITSADDDGDEVGGY